LSLRPIFENLDMESLKKLYKNYIDNQLFLKKTLWWNFFPYFFRHLPEWLVKGLKEVVETLIFFLVEISSNPSILKENTKIKVNWSKNVIIVEKTPKEYKNFKNQVFNIKFEHNWIPIAYMKFINPIT
jgi:hypothetical protein